MKVIWNAIILVWLIYQGTGRDRLIHPMMIELIPILELGYLQLINGTAGFRKVVVPYCQEYS